MSKNCAIIIQFVLPLATFYRSGAQRSDVYKRDVFVTSWRFHNRAWQPQRHDRLPETSRTLWIHRGALTNQRCSIATGCRIDIYMSAALPYKENKVKWIPYKENRMIRICRQRRLYQGQIRVMYWMNIYLLQWYHIDEIMSIKTASVRMTSAQSWRQRPHWFEPTPSVPIFKDIYLVIYKT